MLDIENIKNQIDEILLNNEKGIIKETEEDYDSEDDTDKNTFLNRLFSYLKKSSDYIEIYKDKKPLSEKFEDDLKDFCETITTERMNYRLPLPYKDINWIKVDGHYYDGDEIYTVWKDFCENLPVEDIEVNGDEFNESYQPLNENLYMSKYDRNDYTSGTHIPRAWYENGRDRDGNLVKKISMKKIYKDIHVGSLIFDTNTDTTYIIIEFERGNTDLAFSPIKNLSKIYRTTVDDIIEYFRESSWTLLEDPHIDIDINNDKPETSGDEFNESLNESVLMEMPATNYTTFDIEPYLICDDIYPETEDGETDYEAIPSNPLDGYTNDKDTYAPTWVEEKLRRREWSNIPAMNDKIDTEMVYIVSIPGYYEGATVGILSRDPDDYDFFNSLFSDTDENDEGERLYAYEGVDRPYVNGELQYTEEQGKEILRKLLSEQIKIAQQVIIEWSTKLGCKIVPSSYKETLPPKNGEEFNECVDKQINEIIRISK